MSDHIQTKTWTNWYTFFLDVWVPYIASIGFISFLFYTPLDFFTIMLMILFMVGMSVIISLNSWRTGNEVGINYTMETLIENGLLLTEVVDNQVTVKPASNVVAYEKCTKCDEGVVYSPSITKLQNELGNEEE